jgi:hypothetical protein
MTFDRASGDQMRPYRFRSGERSPAELFSD